MSEPFANIFGPKLPATTSSKVRTVESFGTCPACQKPLMGHVWWEVEMDEATPAESRVARLKPASADMSHRCSAEATTRTVN